MNTNERTEQDVAENSSVTSTESASGATNSSPEAPTDSSTATTILPTSNNDLREKGFTSVPPPLFEQFQQPEGMHYLKLYLEQSKEAQARLGTQMNNVGNILKQHGASQALGNDIASFLYKNFDEDAKSIHESQIQRAEADKVRLEAENSRRALREGEEYRQKLYETERRDNLEKTSEWQKAKKLFDAKLAQGHKEFASDKLGDLMYNETFTKLASELTDLRLARDKSYFPAPPKTPEEQVKYNTNYFKGLWQKAG